MSFIVAIIVLGVLVIVHEFGHFIVAKFFKVGILEYSIGFGPLIIKKKIGETWYCVRLIPLGGYVRMAGEEPDTSFIEDNSDKKNSEIKNKDSEEEISNEENKKDSKDSEGTNIDYGIPSFFDEDSLKLMKDETRWFIKKHVFKRFLIVLAGPMANVIFAFLLGMFCVAKWGIDLPLNKAIVGDFVQGYPAIKSGLKVGDEIYKVNGKRVTTWMSAAREIGNSPNGEVNLLIRRTEKGKLETHNIKIVAMEDTPEYKVMAGNDKRYIGNKLKVGIVPKQEFVKVPLKYAPLYSLSKIVGITVMTYRGFRGIFLGAISTKHLGGPIEIVRVTAETSQKGVEKLFDLVIFISMTLAIMNILPIPVLDGGHLLFFAIEGIIRRPVPIQIQVMATKFGIILLLMLMFYAISNDLTRIIE